MTVQTAVTVRMFGALHGIRKDRGLPSVVELDDIPEQGCAAYSLLERLDLPKDKVDAVFINFKMYSLDHEVHPGDKIAFVPIGVPGSRGLFSPEKPV